MKPQITSIAEDELGASPDRIEPVERGLIHATYELKCRGGDYVLQFSGEDDWAADVLHHGLNCYRLLADTEVPVPDVVTKTPGEHDGRSYVLVERLPGETGEGAISPERVRDAGRCLATIHDVMRFEATGKLWIEDGEVTVNQFHDGAFEDRVFRRFEDNVHTLKEHGLVTGGDLVDRVAARIPTDFDPVFCHDDYSPDNVLFVDDAITGVIDFDYALAGHDQHDLAKAANAFWMQDPRADWDVRTTLYEGYREVRTLDGSWAQNERLYRAVTHAGIVAVLIRMDELSGDEIDVYAETIPEAIDRIPTA